MLSKLVLTNFQKHEDLTVNFTGGLNAIRGMNENGKSSVMRGIAYAFFGSKALPMSLEETVTWGKAVSTLKVELTFSHAGQEFTITRKKSGAELVGEGVTASGQAEVTAFVEKLFGASAAVAQATMLSSQSSLQDGLDSSAMPLIEKLANMSLIDELITKVQTNLPSGSTKGVEAQMQAVSAIDEPVLDISELELAVNSKLLESTSTNEKLEQAVQEQAALEPIAKAAAAKQAKNKTAKALRENLQQQLSKLDTTVPEFVEPDIEALRAAAQAQKQREVLVAAWNKYKSIPEFDKMSADVYADLVKSTTDKLTQVSARVSDIRVQMATKKAMRITESACGLCGKDLSEVPEVVAKNSKIDAELAELENELEQQMTIRQDANTELARLDSYKANDKNLGQYLPINFVEVSELTIPRTLSWVGGEIPELDGSDKVAELRKAEQDIAAHQKAVSAAELAKKLQVELTQKLESIEEQELSELEVVAEFELTEASKKVDRVRSLAWQLEKELSTLKADIQTKKEVYKANKASWDASLSQKAKLVELLNDYHFHNGIIAKLREARPAVAAKLWALVLSGVSHYFSQIRGVTSSVTRGEKGFMVDGKSIDALSGSTKDSLGLAIRLMLQKTFLPSVGFLLLDEAAAACDDVRESNMLAVLASSGLDQVILVTHSDLADTFASNVITI